MATVAYRNVSKSYRGGVQALTDFDLRVEDGEFLVLVGPSGCGKTTALMTLAGLEQPTSGEVAIDDQVVNNLDPGDRDVAVVFQNYALYPHMTVYDNLSFALRMHRFPKPQIHERVSAVAKTLGLEELLRRKPAELSGGQRQRVAMGRAIVRNPKVFLMDEPLSNLDAKLRGQMRAEISALQHELQATTIYVTHDQVEAMTMGDRIALLRDGRIQQAGSPESLYDTPTNIFAASFIGTPPMNFINAQVLFGSSDSVTLVVGEQRLPLPPQVVRRRQKLRRYADAFVALGIRPEDLSITDGGGAATFHAKVKMTESLGSEVLLHLDMRASRATNPDVLQITRQDPIEWIGLGEARESVVRVVARVGRGIRPEIGEIVPIKINPEHVHLFDLETGFAI